MAKKLTNKLLNLPPEVAVTGVQTLANADVYSLSFPEAERVCPYCGSTHCVVKGSSQQKIRHLPVGGRPIFLSFHKHRYLCRDCGRTFNELPYWVHPTLRMSANLYFTILFDLTELIPISAIASKNAVTPSIVNDVLALQPAERPTRLPETLCIDEFKGDAGTWDNSRRHWNRDEYQVGIADARTGCIIDVLPSTLAGDIKSYFFQYNLHEREHVRYFCCDMHNGYVTVAKTCFPNAIICIDLFHVVKRLNDMVDTVRRRLQNDTRDTEPESYKLLKHTSKLFLTKKSNQASLWQEKLERRKRRLQSALDAFPDLSEAYDALQEFHSIIAENSYSLQRTDLTEWIHKYISSEVEEVRSAARTIRHWRGYIQNSWKYDKSNGPCEGLNNKIKVLKRISFGIHDFESFRKRILLVCGYMHRNTSRNLSYKALLGVKNADTRKEVTLHA